MSFLNSIVSGIGDIVTGNWDDLLGDVGDIFDDGADLAGKIGPTAVSAYAADKAYQGQNEANQAMQSMFNQNIGWQGQSQQNAFGHDREMATAQMAFQDYQSKTQYQRAMTDLGQAGLNPVLAAAHGGNAALSGSAPTSSGMGGSSIPSIGNKAAAGLSGAASAASIANMAAQNDLLKSQARNVDAQTATELNRPENVRQDTRYKTSSAQEADYRVVKLIEEADKLRDEILAKGPQSEADLNRARTRLANVEAKLAELGVPEAKASSEMYKTPLGTKLPYIHEGEKFLNSAGGAVRDIGGFANRRNLNRFIIEGK